MMRVIVIIGCFENQIFEQSDIDNRIFGQTNGFDKWFCRWLNILSGAASAAGTGTACVRNVAIYAIR